MKKGYIPKDQRKKILMLSDDIRSFSGVGNQAREIVHNTAHHYNWVNLGGAVNHPDHMKGFDLSQEINKKMDITNEYSATIEERSKHTDWEEEVKKNEVIEKEVIKKKPPPPQNTYRSPWGNPGGKRG